MDFPIIDIADIDKEDSQVAIAKQITKASREWGFLLLQSHPIPNGDIEEMFTLARDFFVNTEESSKVPWPVNRKYLGYSGPLTDGPKDDKASMWFNSKPGLLSQNLDALPPFWHSHLDKIEAFTHKCHSVVIKLLQCFAIAMDLPDRNFFAKAHAEDAGNRFRMICYPARDNAPLASTTRMSAHSDSGSVTLLFQTTPGLEVESPESDSWVRAPHIPGCILVNLGDALSFWSGGRLKATKHRVTFEGVQHDQERLSIAYFGAASPETVLEPIKTGDGQEKMEKYEANDMILHPGITVGEYSKRIMENIYGSSVAPAKIAGTPDQVKAAA